MKLLKVEQNGSISMVINSSSYQSIPPGFVAFEVDIDDLVLINNRYVKDGQLKERIPQPSQNHVWDLTTESWQLDLNQLRQSKSKEIDQACKQTIISGFVSWALGAPHHYPSKDLDQQNLAASVLASYDPENEITWTTPFWCSDSAGDWSFVSHTASQIREVGRDAKSSILTFQFKNEQLQAAIAEASTAEQLEAINW